MKNSIIKKELETYCELHWWNMGKKTLSFKGELKDLLEKQNIIFTIKKETEYLFIFNFENNYGITFKQRGLISDFPMLAKQMIQMELVRMGDKSKLYVANTFRPTVTVNF
jgi:uncharacterized protein YtpQ (UPF0354 family)